MCIADVIWLLKGKESELTVNTGKQSIEWLYVDN